MTALLYTYRRGLFVIAFLAIFSKYYVCFFFSSAGCILARLLTSEPAFLLERFGLQDFQLSPPPLFPIFNVLLFPEKTLLIHLGYPDMEEQQQQRMRGIHYFPPLFFFARSILCTVTCSSAQPIKMYFCCYFQITSYLKIFSNISG